MKPSGRPPSKPVTATRCSSVDSRWHAAGSSYPGTPDSKAGLWPLSSHSLCRWQWVRSFTNMFICICRISIFARMVSISNVILNQAAAEGRSMMFSLVPLTRGQERSHRITRIIGWSQEKMERMTLIIANQLTRPARLNSSHFGSGESIETAIVYIKKTSETMEMVDWQSCQSFFPLNHPERSSAGERQKPKAESGC